MLSSLAILATISAIANGQPTGKPEKPGECCETKMVGGIWYSYVGKMDTKMYNCLNPCVYQKKGEEGAKFCFAMGEEKVECKDEDITKPPMGGSEKPPMEGSEKPPVEGSEKPPVGGSEKPPVEGSTKPAGQGCKCGIKKTSRIVGGQETEVNEYPWMAAIADENENFFCGSTLIGAQWVVTASHCMFKENDGTDPWTASELTIVLGEHDIASTTESVIPRKTVLVSKIITHENYDADSSDKDVALLKLAEPVDLTVYTPACVAQTGDTFVGKNAWVYGWGRTTFGGIIPDKLLEVEVPIVSTEECKLAMWDDSIKPGMLCAGGVEGEDGCQGDSGGPLTVDVSGQHTLVGDVSWGNQCGLDGQYGVYAETAFYRNWIDTNIEANGGISYCQDSGVDISQRAETK